MSRRDVMKQLAKPLLLLLLVLALGMKPSRRNSLVGGDCLYNCEGSTCADFGNTSSMCQQLRAKCQARCSGKRWWGAIAYSKKDKAYGWSTGVNDRDAAKKEAMQKCVQHGGTGCEFWAIYENECGAVAIDGSITTWGTAYLRKDAQARALLECQKAGGKNCTIQVWSCSTM
jgi:hypothetical protein